MPGKARRVASRQAQLSHRKKRQQKGPAGIPLSVPAPTAIGGQTADGTARQAPEPEARAPEPVRPSPAATRPATATSSPTFSRARGERPPPYSYVGAELRRILIMAGTVLAVIIVLGIVL